MSVEDRLASKERQVERLKAELKKVKDDHKSLAGNVRGLKARNTVLKAKLAHMVDICEDGHEKLEAVMLLASDCKHLD